MTKARTYKVTIDSEDMMDSKEDRQAFINKFGEDALNRFNLLKGRMKNRNISTDIVWHIKHTSTEEMEKLLNSLEDREVTENGKAHENIGFHYSDADWEIKEPLDWQTAMNLGEGTVWCITGRYNTGGEVKPSQAKKYFDEYLGDPYATYYFIWDKKNGKKYCLCPFKKNDEYSQYHLWTADDERIDKLEQFPKIKEFPRHIYEDPSLDYITDLDGDILGYRGQDSDVLIPGGPTVVFMYDTPDEVAKRIKTIRLSDGVTRIGAFQKLTSLERISMNEGLISIEGETFLNLPKLNNIRIPNSVKYIDIDAFKGCKGLTDFDMRDCQIDMIESECFMDCESLRWLNFPKTLKGIGDFAFFNCKALKYFDCESASIETIFEQAFAYSGLKEVLFLPDSLKIIGYKAFAHTNVREVFFPENQNLIISRTAFEGCPLHSIILPKNSLLYDTLAVDPRYSDDMSIEEKVKRYFSINGECSVTIN